MQASHTTHLVNSLHGEIECHELTDRLQTSLGRTKRVNVQEGKEGVGEGRGRGTWEVNKGGEVDRGVVEGEGRGRQVITHHSSAYGYSCYPHLCDRGVYKSLFPKLLVKSFRYLMCVGSNER